MSGQEVMGWTTQNLQEHTMRLCAREDIWAWLFPLISKHCLRCQWVHDLLHLFLFLIYHLIWLCWVFVAAQGLVVASGGFSSLRCVSFSLWPLLLLWSMGSSAHGLNMDLLRPGVEPVSPVLLGRFLTTRPPEKSSASFLQKAFLCPTAQQLRADLFISLMRDRSDKRTVSGSHNLSQFAVIPSLWDPSSSHLFTEPNVIW